MSVSIPGYRIDETLHASSPRIVYRAQREADGKSVVLKTLADAYPSRHDVAELEREYALTQGLGEVEGVIEVQQLLRFGNGSVAIEMEHFGQSLAKMLVEQNHRPLPLARFFELAIPMAQILGRVHEQGVVHKDVVPRNVLVSDAGDQLRLIDFGISSELRRERQATNLSKRLEGSLPYISPEQTGRMNRALDYRSDYYSLGVTYFELLTGQLPFEADDVLEWVHRHISQVPPSASSLNSHVPEALAAILLKLMAKNAEDRYQSTFGLICDLERCRDEYARSGKVEPFELGSHDVSRRFQLPQRLYGRDEELRRLRGLFEDVTQGGTELCLVAGYSGVGKSALVNELSKSIVREKGYLIQGKFDQFQQNTAYAAIAHAFRDLISQLLTETPARLEAWRKSIAEAVGQNGQLLIDLVPQLELIIGEQPAVPELPPTEAQNRFHITFAAFTRVFANASHPLVIFLDDLQWSDAPTLKLLQRLVLARDLHHLFIIGAFRDNEVDPGHPLTLALDELGKQRRIETLDLTPLDLGSVVELVAETMRSKGERVASLAQLLHTKSRGNPFFVNELLKTLRDEGAIHFDPDQGMWSWDEARVRQAELSDNVVEFMVGTLRKLPTATQEVLRLAACIGSRFDLEVLAIIHESDHESVARDLLPALKRNIVVPLHDDYRLVGAGSGAHDDGEALNPGYRFQHDRVQQAAYELIGEDRKREVHLSIARLMDSHVTPEEERSRIFDIVTHYNAGRSLLTDEAEKLKLAGHNLTAGMAASASSAYAAALELLLIGDELLPEQPWEKAYELTLQLATERQACAYLTGDYALADGLVDEILTHATTKLERAEVLAVRTRQYATMGKMRESIVAAIEGLNLLDLEFSEDPDDAMVQREVELVVKHLRGRAISELVDAPAMEEERHLVASRVLMEIFPAAFLSGSGTLFPYLVLKSVNLALEHGNSPESAFSYAAYGMILCGKLDEPALGFEYARTGVEVIERLGDIQQKSRVIYVYAMFVHHWNRHWKSMTPWFQQGIESGYQSGDMLYLAYSAQDCIIWDPTLDLETVSREQRRYLQIVKDTGYQDSYDSGTLFLQMSQNFRGETEDTFSLSDDEFDEDQCVEGMLARRFMTGIANYQIYKAEVHALYGDYEGAREFVDKQEPMLASSMSLPQLVRFYIVAFLTRATLLASGKVDAAETRPKLEAYLAQMSGWADNCEENFRHLQRLMEAELAALDGDFERALHNYDEAIDLAARHEFRRDAAVANERAARQLTSRGFKRAAAPYLANAHYLFYRWGAVRKVQLLEERHPELAGTPDERSGHTTHRTRSRTRNRTTSSEGLDAGALDLASIMKASQAISGEMVLEQLWRKTMQILLENAGGTHGFFVSRSDGELHLEAQGSALQDLPALTGSFPIVGQDEKTPLPSSLINKVIRTGEPLVLNDPEDTAQFANDPYFAREQPQSAICIPIRHGQFDGALYLENRVTSGAFTQDRVEIIKLLSAQASISIENAKLYDDQLRLTQAQQRFVPSQFLESLGHDDIARVGLGEFVAKEMSVMFSDLRRFTPLSEALGPRRIIELLNRYFSRLEKPIASAGGFIDSFNGDEVMALFGVAPIRAVQAGVDMWRELEVFNRESVAEGGPELIMGIGLNTGPLVLGTVGGQDRLKCGVVGDTVNLASRIEQLTKTYDARFLIGGSTYEGLGDKHPFSIRHVDRVAVKGKQRAVDLYEVLDADSPESRERKQKTLPYLQRALAHYFEREFAEAVKALAEATRIDPNDFVLRRLAARCDNYARNPPPPEWGGFEKLTHK